jgi:hypothetical protein
VPAGTDTAVASAASVPGVSVARSIVIGEGSVVWSQPLVDSGGVSAAVENQTPSTVTYRWETAPAAPPVAATSV